MVQLCHRLDGDWASRNALDRRLSAAQAANSNSGNFTRFSLTSAMLSPAVQRWRMPAARLSARARKSRQLCNCSRPRNTAPPDRDTAAHSGRAGRTDSCRGSPGNVLDRPTARQRATLVSHRASGSELDQTGATPFSAKAIMSGLHTEAAGRDVTVARSRHLRRLQAAAGQPRGRLKLLSLRRFSGKQEPKT